MHGCHAVACVGMAPMASPHFPDSVASGTLARMDDAEFIRQFECCTLPFQEWIHRAHVKVAYLYLRRHAFDEALEHIRRGIKAYNAINSVPESATSGYNETTTHAFLHLVAATMNAYDAVFPTTTADSFCDTHPQLMSKHVLRLFYSPARRMHPLAKTRFIEPDLAPLPMRQSGPGADIPNLRS